MKPLFTCLAPFPLTHNLQTGAPAAPYGWVTVTYGLVIGLEVTF